MKATHAWLVAAAVCIGCYGDDVLTRGRENGARAAFPPGTSRWAFPAGSGVVDVKDAYGAKGDGRTDDTAALARAVAENVGRRRILYFPRGVYLVHDTLDWRTQDGTPASELGLQGESERDTVIRLIDAAPLFGDPQTPRPVVRTNSLWEPSDPPERKTDGGGNKAFHNAIYDLTIEVGAANPGAVGIDLLGNHGSAVRRVTVRSLDPGRVGRAGLAATRFPGPVSLDRITVHGFDRGLDIGGREYGVTVEHLALLDQREVGVLVADQIVSLRNVQSRNRVPALRTVQSGGFVSLIGAQLTGGAGDAAAIESDGGLYARGVQTGGYGVAVRQGTTTWPGPRIDELASTGAQRAFEAAPATAVRLAEIEVPQPRDLGAGAVVAPVPSGGDDSQALQSALDTGGETVVLPPGRFIVRTTLHVPATVQHVLGVQSILAAEGDAPLVRTEGAGDAALVIDRVELTGARPVVHAAARALVLRDAALRCPAATCLDITGSGRVFLDNVGTDELTVPANADVRARGLTVDRAVKASGTLWSLGFFSQATRTAIDARRGATVEVLGALLYALRASTEPAFVVQDARASFGYAVSAYVDSEFPVDVRETRGAETRDVSRSALPARGRGTLVPLFSAH